MSSSQPSSFLSGWVARGSHKVSFYSDTHFSKVVPVVVVGLGHGFLASLSPSCSLPFVVLEAVENEEPRQAYVRASEGSWGGSSLVRMVGTILTQTAPAYVLAREGDFLTAPAACTCSKSGFWSPAELSLPDLLFFSRSLNNLLSTGNEFEPPSEGYMTSLDTVT